MDLITFKPRLAFASALAVVCLVGCGGGDDDSAGEPDGGEQVDADVDAPPGCQPVVPTATVIAPGGSDVAASVRDLVVTSTGRVGVFHWISGGVAARVWDGSSWTRREVYGGSNGGYSAHAVSEIDGRPVLLATPSDTSGDSDKLRAWPQLASGDFAAGQVVQVAPNDVDVATVARYSPTSSVLAAAGMTGDFRTLLSYERGPTGSWAVQFVDAVATQFGSVYADGVGTLADGTAVITSHGAEGLILHRRTGLQWSDYRTLVAGEVIAGAVAFPPAGSPAPFAVAVYQRSGTQAQRGALVSLTDGTASADTELLPVGGIDYSEVAFDPDGTRGTILLVDADGRRAWIATFEGAAFTTATELRPDRVFETGPHIVQHPCGGTMILHVTRAPTDAEWSAPAVLEPLADFRVP